MPKIKQLSPHEAQKIAAGEVVERPANVIKELIENAIDAQATAITIYLNNGGQTLIRVVDNGCGMDEVDAQQCFNHHATSKITIVEDLYTLNTFGFRGEALSSIAAVSKVTLTTKTDDCDYGVMLTYQEQKVLDKQYISCNNGTDILIKDLFYNVPARKKFLKSRETELRAITQLFQAFCLDYLTIHFQLFSEDRLLFQCPPVQNAIERCVQLWGSSMATHLLSLPVTNNKIGTISGIISNHQWFRYDRSQLFFFVNSRWVKNQALSKALLKGYAKVLPTDKFASACIFISIDPASVDINIHPRKEEVQFLQPRLLEQSITDLVKKTLEDSINSFLHKSVTPTEDHCAANYSVQKPLLYPTSIKIPQHVFQGALTQSIDEDAQLPTHIKTFGATQPILPNQIQQVIAAKTPLQEDHSFTILGQLDLTYILIAHNDGLLMVDQHAAHERIIYQQLIDHFETAQTMPLLFPLVVTLTKDQCTTINPALPLLGAYGLVCEPFGENQIAIKGSSPLLKNISFQTILEHFVLIINEQQLLEQVHINHILHEKIRAQLSCKAAVKAGDFLSTEQMQQLLKDLYKTDNRFACPHGRPTSWLLSLTDIEKKFKRNYQ